MIAAVATGAIAVLLIVVALIAIAWAHAIRVSTRMLDEWENY